MGLCNCGPHSDPDEAPPNSGILQEEKKGDMSESALEKVPSFFDTTLAAIIEQAVGRLRLESSQGEAMTYASHRMLEPSRKKIFSAAFPEIASEDKVVAIIGQETTGNLMREFIAVLKGETSGMPELQLVNGSCQIFYEDLTPSECVEYSFAEAPESFALAQISRDALESYRSMKFEAWKHMLMEPSCEAAFRRMLQIGVVTQLYDPHVFPTPEGKQKSAYQVVDEKTGKLLDLPHPVAKLRVWEANKGRYEALDTRLGGAPSQSDEAAWWQNLLSDFRTRQGAEYIDGLLRG